MIVFSGPTTTTDHPQGLLLSTESERTIPSADLVQPQKVNLSDLANITTEVLCRLQQLFNNNNSVDEWVWELTDVNISDIVRALGLDGYIALSDVVIVPAWFKTIITALFVIVLAWSGVSNLRTSIAIGIAKSSWSSTNALIGFLAVSDLLTVACTTPTEMSFVVHDLAVWEFGSFGCVTLPFLQSTAILSNALILCLIAHDRYVCVVKLQPYAINSKATWKTATAIGLVWIVSIGISIPAFWLWRVYHFIVVDDVPDPVFGIDFCSVFSVCTANNGLPPDELPVYHIVLCGAIFIPLFVLFTILYVRIGHFLWVRTPVGTGDTIGQLARKKRVAWALFWLIITFFFCRMPIWIFTIATMYTRPQQTSSLQMLKSTLVFLSVFNTALNPWLYSRLNESLNKAKQNCTDNCCEILSCFKSCCQGPTVVNSHSTSSDRQQNNTPQIPRNHRQIHPSDEGATSVDRYNPPSEPSAQTKSIYEITARTGIDSVKNLPSSGLD